LRKSRIRGVLLSKAGVEKQRGDAWRFPSFPRTEEEYFGDIESARSTFNELENDLLQALTYIRCTPSLGMASKRLGKHSVFVQTAAVDVGYLIRFLFRTNAKGQEVNKRRCKVGFEFA
jgi:hypothetical protein